MPIQKVGLGGYRFGQQGKIYYGPNAYKLARAQGAAIHIPKLKKR